MNATALVLAVSLAASPFGSFSGTGARGGNFQSASPGARVPKTTVLYGDSIAAGYGNSTIPSVLLDALLPGGQCHSTPTAECLSAVGANATSTGWFVAGNLPDGQPGAVSGYTAHQIVDRIQDTAATACLGEPCGVYIVEGGVNTLKSGNVNGFTPAAAADFALNGDGGANLGMLDGLGYLLAMDPRPVVIAVGVLPYAGCNNVICPSGVEDARLRAEAYNSALQSACTSLGIICVLPYSTFNDPDNQGYLLPAHDQGDGIHLSQAGARELALGIYNSRNW